MFSWIGKVFGIVKNLPAIIALIEQLIDLIKPLVGSSEVDEVEQVARVKRKAADLGDKAGLKNTKERLMFDR